MDLFGHVRHPETGECLAFVKDGKITGVNAITYKVVGDQIVDANDKVVGYLSHYQGPANGNSDLANELFRRR
jgi:hypothetical protein